MLTNVVDLLIERDNNPREYETKVKQRLEDTKDLSRFEDTKDLSRFEELEKMILNKNIYII